MIDDRTNHLHLPLPSAGNRLDEDVIRLREALNAVDVALHGIDGAVSTALANLIGAAPAALDTLKELADAIANDPQFAATIAGQISTILSTLATKADASTVATSLSGKQATLVSGVNVKTVGGKSILGSGDIVAGVSPSFAFFLLGS